MHGHRWLFYVDTQRLPRSLSREKESEPMTKLGLVAAGTDAQQKVENLGLRLDVHVMECSERREKFLRTHSERQTMVAGTRKRFLERYGTE